MAEGDDSDPGAPVVEQIIEENPAAVGVIMKGRVLIVAGLRLGGARASRPNSSGDRHGRLRRHAITALTAQTPKACMACGGPEPVLASRSRSC